jgi:hypothetical protein
MQRLDCVDRNRPKLPPVPYPVAGGGNPGPDRTRVPRQVPKGFQAAPLRLDAARPAA